MRRALTAGPVGAVAVVVAAILLAAACREPPRVVYPEIGFGDHPQLRIAAGSLEVVDAYHPPLAPPHVEHFSPALPSAVFRRWAEQRLAPAGGAARLRVTIADARIVETRLETNRSVEGALTTERAARLDGRGAVTVTLIGPAGKVLANVHGEATRGLFVPEDATLNEREELMFQITEDLAHWLDEVLEANIHEHFAAWMR